MINAPIPENEQERLAAVLKLEILDTPAEERFDRITRLAIKLFDVPISTITIMDSKREWYKSCQGVEAREAPRIISFCGHVIAQEEEMLVVEDTKKDIRFSDNPMVVGSPRIRFYAGIPIFALTGERVGVFCIKDTKARILTEIERFLLQVLASWAQLEINFLSLINTLNEENGSEKVKPLLETLLERNVLENFRSIKLGLKLKMKDDNTEELIETKKAIDREEELLLKIQNTVENKI